MMKYDTAALSSEVCWFPGEEGCALGLNLHPQAKIHSLHSAVDFTQRPLSVVESSDAVRTSRIFLTSI